MVPCQMDPWGVTFCTLAPATVHVGLKIGAVDSLCSTTSRAHGPRPRSLKRREQVLAKGHQQELREEPRSASKALAAGAQESLSALLRVRVEGAVARALPSSPWHHSFPLQQIATNSNREPCTLTSWRGVWVSALVSITGY